MREGPKRYDLRKTRNRIFFERSIVMNRNTIIAAFFALVFLGGQCALAQSGYNLFQKGLVQERVKGDLDEAIKIYERIIVKFPNDRPIAAKALLHIGLCKEKLGRNEAINAYQKVMELYPEQQGEVATAKERLDKLSKTLEKVAYQPIFQKIQIPYDAFRLRPSAPLSPDGKSIAFVLDSKLWVMPRVGKLDPDIPGAPKLLNTGDIKVAWGGEAWSGDSRWIAFWDTDEWNEKEKRWGNRWMYVISVDGGKPKKVYENWRYGDYLVNYRMSLSPKGKTLAFSIVDANEQHIYTISVDGGVPIRLVEAPSREPVFSPDGKRIAYVADKDKGARGGGLWVVSADGGTPRLIADVEHATNPVWSPDGRMIAFRDQGESKKIFIIPIGEDGEPVGERITIGCPEGTDWVSRLTGWTPDNKLGTIFAGHRQYGLYTLPATGGIVTVVASGGELLRQPRWSPDGKRIICTVASGEGRDGWRRDGLASVSAEGGEISTIQVLSDSQIIKLSYGGGNHVSPDGQTIVFAGRRAGQKAWWFNHIWTIDIKGREPKQLTNASVPLTDWYPCWSPDGKSVAFIRCKNDPIEGTGTDTGIFIIPANGGEPRQLTRKYDNVLFGYIAWSPDGKWLSYFSLDKENPKSEVVLKVVPAEGGASRVVGKVEQGFDVRMESAWSPDSKRIALIETDYKVIKIMSLDDGSIVEIDPHLAHTQIWHLDWSRNGDRLVFSGRQGGGLEFWTMENFLPESTAGE
jgi:Tol biopolymer transport system component